MVTRKQALIKRIKGRLKAVNRTKRNPPYSKWVTNTKHVMYNTQGLFILDTSKSKRYSRAEGKTIKELESILRKI